jgi:hypothetical protein
VVAHVAHDVSTGTGVPKEEAMAYRWNYLSRKNNRFSSGVLKECAVLKIQATSVGRPDSVVAVAPKGQEETGHGRGNQDVFVGPMPPSTSPIAKRPVTTIHVRDVRGSRPVSYHPSCSGSRIKVGSAIGKNNDPVSVAEDHNPTTDIPTITDRTFRLA